jgi:hypothetical protein
MAAQPKYKTQVKVEDPRARELLFDALKQRARGNTAMVKVTKADAVALTGMPSEQAEPALKSLVGTYRSHMAVTEEGELVYEFDPSLERRDKVPLSERLRKVGQVAWKGFQLFFKLWIVVTLVAYVVAFIAMAVSLMVAKQGNDRDDRRGGGGGGIPWLWFWLMPDLAPPGYYRDAYGRPIRQTPKSQKRFYNSVFDFVFGPKTAPVDARAEDKQLLAFLRANKGRMTATELSALGGTSLAGAEEELTRLMVEYDGEVEVADDGTLLYVFEQLMPSAGATGQGAKSWAWSWDQPDPLPPLTGNPPGANAATAGFAAFNLIGSMTIGPAFLQRFHLTGDPLATFFVTLFPLLFSAVFFAVPATRWLVRQRKLKTREKRQLRRALMREIWSAPALPRDPDELATLAAATTGLPQPNARAMVEGLLKELEGDVVSGEKGDGNGKPLYVFPRLAEEQIAVDKARAATPERRLGEVIFSSDDEEPVRG